MSISHNLPLSANSRFNLQGPGSVLQGNNSLLFFASLLEKIKLLSKSSGQTSASKSITILLADDDEDDRELFEEAISLIDPVIGVETVQNGSELMTLMKNGIVPEIIFLDLNMPGKTGKDCLAEIRAHHNWNNIPVFIYSTSANKKDISDTYTGGANLYVLKPTSFTELLSVIRKAFSFDWEATPRLSQHDYVLKYSA